MPSPRLGVSITEYHTAGEPFRIVTGGVPPIKGQNVLEKRRFAQENIEFIGTPISATTVAGRDAVLTEVVGSAHMTGIHHLVLDPHDPLGTGFILR